MSPDVEGVENKGQVSRQPLEIVPVEGRDELRRFLDLPKALYARDSAWVAPLDMERRDHLSRRNPYFRHAAFQAWTVRRGERTLGRISAQVDQLHLRQHGDRTGFFGMIEAVDDPAVFQALFDTAQEWLAGQGMDRIMGPFNLSINDELGLLVEGFDTPPVVMMGHGLPYYADRIEEQGFRKAKDLVAYWINGDFPAPRHLDELVARVGQRVRLRSLSRRHFHRDLAIIKDIFEDAWANNWGYVPFTDEEFAQLGTNLRLLVPLDYVCIAELDGEPVAMMALFPNLNEAIRDLGGRLFPFGWLKLLWRLKVKGVKTGRVPLMGVRRRFQGGRLGATLALMMISSLRSAGRNRGMEDVEMSWILEDNRGVRNIIESIGGQAYKRYRIYEKELSGGCRTS